MVREREGYAQFSSRRVAQEVGISLGNIQHFCGNTENLLILMITAKLKPFVERLNALTLESEQPASERLASVIENDVNATLDPWTRSFCFQLGALAKDNPQVGALLNRLYEEYLSELTALIKIINPALLHDQALILAVSIATQIEGYFFYADQTIITPEHRARIIALMKKTWLAAMGDYMD